MPCNIDTKKPTMKLGVIKFQVYERVPSYTASENTIKCRESTSGRAVYLPHEGTLLADVEVRYGVEKLLVQSSIVVSEEIRNYERKRKRELVDSEKKGEPARKKKREKILGFGRTDLEPEKKRLKKIEKKRLQKIEKKRLQKIEKKRLQKIEKKRLQKIEKKRLQKIEEERVKERIKEKRRKTTTSDSDSSDSGNKSLTSLSERKKMLKAQLKKFDSDFCRERGRLPREAEKEPIWHLYEQYNKLKGLLEKANNKTKKPVNTKKGGGRRSYPEQSQGQSSDESSDSGSNSETETQDEKSGKGKKTKEKSEQQGNGKRTPGKKTTGMIDTPMTLKLNLALRREQTIRRDFFPPKTRVKKRIEEKRRIEYENLPIVKKIKTTKKTKWTAEEENAVKRGYELFSGEKNLWAKTKEEYADILENRSSVQIKDKWRTITKQKQELEQQRQRYEGYKLRQEKTTTSDSYSDSDSSDSGNKANNKTKKLVNTKKGGGRRSYPEQSQSQSSDESSDSGSNSETETQDEKSGKGKKTNPKSKEQGNGKSTPGKKTTGIDTTPMTMQLCPKHRREETIRRSFMPPKTTPSKATSKTTPSKTTTSNPKPCNTKKKK